MKIGWIGAGIMGSPMIMHLIDRQYEVHVYARHAEKIKLVLDKGAILEKEIKNLVQECDVICTMVGFPSDVKEVYEEIFKWVDAGKVCIDFTTSSPKLAEELNAKLGTSIDRKVISLDAAINKVGEFKMLIKLTSKVKTELPVIVTASEVIQSEIEEAPEKEESAE